MMRGGIVLVAWGVLLLVITAAQLPFSPDGVELGLLGGAGAVCVLCGLIAGLVATRGRRRGPRRAVPELSFATVAVALGLAMVGVGTEAGQWLWLPGCALAALGAAGLVREGRGQ
jgi:hypothetical protein